MAAAIQATIAWIGLVKYLHLHDCSCTQPYSTTRIVHAQHWHVSEQAGQVVLHRTIPYWEGALCSMSHAHMFRLAGAGMQQMPTSVAGVTPLCVYLPPGHEQTQHLSMGRLFASFWVRSATRQGVTSDRTGTG